jgi:hypothetical protein
LLSSVEKEPKAMHSGNTCIHGMTHRSPLLQLHMLPLRYLYIYFVQDKCFCQVRFALLSSGTFTQSDTITDSEHFYNSILQFLEDADKKNEVDALLVWWNWQVARYFPKQNSCGSISQIFPTYSSA